MEAYIKTSYRLGDFLSDEEIIEAWELYKSCDSSTVTNRLMDDFVRPRIRVISEKVGQDCDTRYVAYVLQFVFQQASKSV